MKPLSFFLIEEITFLLQLAAMNKRTIFLNKDAFAQLEIDLINRGVNPILETKDELSVRSEDITFTFKLLPI